MEPTEEIQAKASEYGIASAVCLSTLDALKKSESFIPKISAGRVRAIGKLHKALANLRNGDR